MAPKEEMRPQETTLTPALQAAARSQLQALQQASGVPLTATERQRVMDDASRTRGVFLGPTRERVMDQVTRSFCEVLRRRGDEQSVELANRIERIRREETGTPQPAPTPTTRPTAPAPPPPTPSTTCRSAVRSSSSRARPSTSR